MTFLALIRSKVARWLAVLAGLALAVVAIRRDAVKDEREKARTQALQDALDMHERIGNADTGNGNVDDDREWLRKRANKWS